MCTLERRGQLFILKLTGVDKIDQEHRLNPSLISSIRSALADVKSQAVDGSALITLSEGKFFSNGFDLRHAQAKGVKSGSADAAKDELLRMVDLFRGVVADLMALPMPTIAAVTGHAAAAGLILAMSHDYVTMTSSRSVLYMSELDIGMTLPDYFTALIRGKVGGSSDRRRLVLQAAKVTAEEAVAMGIVDSAHDSPEAVVAAAVRKGEELSKRKWGGKAYAGIRVALYPELCGLLGLKDETVLPSKL
ncbi:putative enoyl-CoA hydratase, mitochondrial-like [Dorcoceras hygrometricum]|uniref:Delta(3)-Delta(2)-enoyl-CoA isomerase n=1 Tax=Dorcoceras hygrometricum TaxID=472368 RepID=A0A2Z7CM73_9LAMI|nr:putative enoyl-CoA hydratase, mitochondrial-like [Dorcoceras hygrometricum]